MRVHNPYRHSTFCNALHETLEAFEVKDVPDKLPVVVRNEDDEEVLEMRDGEQVVRAEPRCQCVVLDDAVKDDAPARRGK